MAARELVSDDLWAAIAPLLPEEPAKPKGGRPRCSDRDALQGIVFVLRSGIPWEMLPREAFGCSGMTCWRRVRDWQRAGVWDHLHRVLLERLHQAGDLDWSRASIDSASIGAKRMARPVCKRRLGDDMISLHKRIRHVGASAAAKMEIRASRSS
jgi:transposase